jgi:hypothetical protein
VSRDDATTNVRGLRLPPGRLLSQMALCIQAFEHWNTEITQWHRRLVLTVYVDALLFGGAIALLLDQRLLGWFAAAGSVAATYGVAFCARRLRTATARYMLMAREIAGLARMRPASTPEEL